MTYHSVQQGWRGFQITLEIAGLELAGNEKPEPLSMDCDMKMCLEMSVRGKYHRNKIRW